MDKQQLQANIARLPFNYSTYVAMAICYAFDWWMDPANAADRQALIQQFPFLLKLGAPISFAAWVLSRAWPQTTAPVPAPAPAPAQDTTDSPALPDGRVPLRLSLEETESILKTMRILKDQGLL